MPHNVGMDWVRLSLRMAIYFRDQFDCIWCRQVFPIDPLGYNLTLDHLDSAGGHRVENLVTSCKSCNSAKRDLSLRDWYQHLKEQGYDVRRVQDRVRRAVRAPINLDMGKCLAAIRRPSYRVGVPGAIVEELRRM